MGKIIKQLNEREKEMMTRMRTYMEVDSWLKYQTRKVANMNIMTASVM